MIDQINNAKISLNNARKKKNGGIFFYPIMPQRVN